MSDEQATAALEEQVSTALTTQRQEKAPIRIGERGLAFESAAEVFRMAQAFVSGGVCPKGMSPGGAMAAMLKGKALGLDEITSVTSIVVVNGRTQMSGSLLLALMRKAGIEYDVWHEGEGNTRTAFIKAWWPWRAARAKTRSFSMGDAARAGLISKDSYKAWPDDMLLWRAVARLARQEFPELAAGIYVFGEVPGDPAPDTTEQVEAGPEQALRPRPAGPDPLLAELAEKAATTSSVQPAEPQAVAPEPARPACETPEHLNAKRLAAKLPNTRSAVCAACGEELRGESISHPDSRPPDDTPLSPESIRKRRRE